VLTDDASIARRVRYLSTQAKDDPVEFVHGDIGYNYRMPNINAAIALAQSERLDEFVGRKRRFIVEYDAYFSEIDGLSMWREMPWAESSCWMAMLTVAETRHSGVIERLRRLLPAQGIEARPAWLPLHRQKPYADCLAMSTEVAERVYRTSLCLPCSTGLTKLELETVARAVVNLVRDAR
jgi:perosamine synthetase